jgi:hypothetical protein
MFHYLSVGEPQHGPPYRLQEVLLLHILLLPLDRAMADPIYLDSYPKVAIR